MSVRACFVSASGQNAFFHELLAALRVELERAGLPTEDAVDHFPPATADRVFVLVPHEYFPLTHLEAHPTGLQMARTVVLNTEQPGTHWFDENAIAAKHAGSAVDINTLGAEELQRRGVAARLLRLGYVPEWDSWGGREDQPRPIDLTFLGGYNTRRARVLARCGPLLTKRRSALHLVDNSKPHTVASDGFLIGEQKWRHLASSKAILNVHRDERPYFEWHRMLGAAANGCVVVTEHSLETEPLVPGEHFISATADSLPYAVAALLDDEERLAADPPPLSMARRDDRRARRQPGAPGGEKPGRRARSRPVHLHPRRRQRRLSARVRTPQRGSRQRPGSGVRLRDPGEVRRGRAVRPRQLPRVGPEAAPPRQLHRRDVADPSIRVRSGRRGHDRPAPRRLGGPRTVVYVRREGDARDARSGDRRPLPRRAPFDDFAHEHRRIRGVVGTAGALSVPADERLTPTLTRVETDLAGTVDGVAERLVPPGGPGQNLAAGHPAPYPRAPARADGRRVLDAGCGTAYGSAILANAGAKEVVGVDVAAEVLAAVAPQMPDRVHLQEADVIHLPFEDGSFDFVVCFEVIEHVEATDAVLDELGRVLRDDGVLAISSPNRDAYLPGNPHHVREFVPDELEAALAKRFAAVRLYRQAD